MCGRYYYEGKTAYDVAKELGLDISSLKMPAGDITPASMAVVLSAEKNGNKDKIRIGTMFWGIKGVDNKLVINARAESVLSKPLFSGSFEYRRCLMPASGFYEWDKDRNKVTFFNKDKSPVYLAGVYQLSQNQDAFTILTTAANSSMIKIHDRMPVMLQKENVRDWLYDYEAAKGLLLSEMPLLDSRQDYEQLRLF